MSENELNHLLDTTERLLPRWELALRQIDPSKNSSISYQVGKVFEINYRMGREQVRGAHETIDRLRHHRTVSDELALRDNLWTLREVASAVVDAPESSSSVVDDFVYLMRETSPVENRLVSEVMTRIGELESSCGASK